MNYLMCSDEILKTEDGVIFAGMDGSGLYRWEIGESVTSLLSCFPNAPFRQKRLYKSILNVGGEIILPPCTADDIMIFDQKTKQIELIEIANLTSQRKGSFKFWTSIHYKDWIYCIGHYYPAIIKMDVRTRKMQYITDWVEIVEVKAQSSELYPYLTDGIVQGEKALLPCCCTNMILELDLQTGETELIEIPADIGGFNGICRIKDEYWLVSRSSDEIVIWNPAKGSIETIRLSSKKGGAEYVSFYSPMITGDDIYLLPVHARHVYRIHIPDRRVTVCEALDYIVELERKEGSYSRDVVDAPALIGDCLFFVTGADCAWHIYDPIQGSEKIFLPQTDPQLYKILEDKKKTRPFWNGYQASGTNGQFPENKRISNEDFFQFICNYQKEIDMAVSRRHTLDQRNGEQIHNLIMKELL